MKQIFKPFLPFFIFLILMLFSSVSFSQVRLPKLVSDGMILQRDTPVKIWGWATAGEKVSIHFNNQNFETLTANNGQWELFLPAQNAGGPFEMKIIGSNQIILKDILFGDVWLCSGQSNIEYPMNRLTDRYASEIAMCENNKIRQFKIPLKYDFNTPHADYNSVNWVAVNPETILNFSAVAYFFARDLFEKYGVPVGIINASVGGSPAEAWMNAEALKDFPQYLAEAEKFKKQSYIDEIQKKERKASDEWYSELNRNDKGLISQPTWKDPAFDASAWPTMPVPGYWANHGLGEVNGVVWFRKEIEIPATFINTKAWIQMGRMVDADSVFINEIFVGTTFYQYPQRKYAIPADVLKPGKNWVVVRLISNSGRGGFVLDKPYRICTNTDTIDIKGDWQYQLGCSMNPTPGQTFVQWQPTGLYNGMIAPSNNYPIKGVVWYQGESNAERFDEYQKLLTALITGWRINRDQGNLPFIIAQLPNFMEAKNQPSESSWAAFRDAQLKTAQTVKNTILTVNIDLGEWNDIHPQNKKTVGERLALAAREFDNKSKVSVLGPVYKSMKIKRNKIVLTFDNSGSGLVSKDGKELKHFAIAGADHKYVWAKAEIKGKKVIVSSQNITNPVAVRYAWADNPDGANLFSKDGLPAVPFSAE